MAKQQETWVTRLVSSKPKHFWWALGLILGTCLAILSWVYIPYVFNNPHKATNYRILDKLGRLQEIKAFPALDPPLGEIVKPKNLYSKFNSLSHAEMEVLNEELLKNYISNFKYDFFNTYIRGNYRVIKTRELTSKDRFTKGIAIQAEAFIKMSKYSDPVKYPVWIEIILPNAPASAVKGIHKGDMLEINKSPFFTSVIGVSRIIRKDDEAIMIFTVVPLVYEEAWKAPHGKKFHISPPKKLNIEGQFPVFPL